MRIQLKLYATLADYLPAGARNNQVELDVAETDPITAILDRHHVPDRLVHLVLVNGVFVPKEERNSRCLVPGDVLAIWPPIAGG